MSGKAETVLTCPLGHKCEDPRDGKVYRCAWFIQLAGQNPQTGAVMDEHGCAMGWMPILMVEKTRASGGIAAAVESLRNVVAGQSKPSERFYMVPKGSSGSVTEAPAVPFDASTAR
ncbi:hypothetical protein [Rhodoferax sp. BLA1]|uniref:hypothetical protein n=1 Tax=Rhodoferax sp. BLA1 TaxID=2576062 RepID=UPI0015D45C66|nr:hypothetical protein [Rhodoferax sp. BLA1]